VVAVSFLENYSITPPVNQALINYQKMEKQKWYLKLPHEQEVRITTLKELQRLYLAEKLPADALIGLAPQSIFPLATHIANGSLFSLALHYLPTVKATPQKMYLSPDLSNPFDKQVYELCEQFKWSYVDGANQKHVVDFKTLHANFLQKVSMRHINFISSPSLSKTPTASDLDKALAVKWKAFSPELLQLESGVVSPLTDVQAKPFIKDMILMNDLDNPSVKEMILKKLSPESEFNAILTGEVQLLDLHGANLGVAPEPNAEYEKFKHLQFSLYPSTDLISFQQLIMKYLESTIDPTTLIQLTENGKTIQKSLKDLPELQKALDVPWQIIIFDTDLSLSEDNRLQFQTRGGVEQHLIPLRSVLLETAWKNQPLSDQTLQRLINSDERDLAVNSWIRKEDAPIYKRLSKTTRKDIENQLKTLLTSITLSKPRKNRKNATIKILQNKFVKEISTMTNAEYLKIWQTLEKDLSFVTILPHDTLETLAKRYHQTVEDLKVLNPKLELKAGQKIKIKYDLTSSSAEAIKKRKQIAGQLFPRLTIRQQQALGERQQRRKVYLTSYQELSQSSLVGSALIDQIENFLSKSEVPLTSTVKKELLDLVQNQRSLFEANPQALQRCKDYLLKECEPSYFNLMKAMYPLLADAYALNVSVYGADRAGINIGFFAAPLEDLILKAKTRFLPNSQEWRLADHLERQINTIKNPAFFGHWG
jgi:LysM repeat protein